jgi:biotin carboxyl carrier protein
MHESARFVPIYLPMKLQAEIGDTKYEIEIRRNGSEIRAVIDGESIDCEVSEPEPNVFLIKRDGKVFETFVIPPSSPKKPALVSLNGRDHEIRLIDPKRLRGSGPGTDSADGVAEIRTAMPGKVVRILVETGAAVNKGDGVLVVEAMKMQNELKSPKDGLVKDIRVGEGDTVSAGDVLAKIE